MNDFYGDALTPYVLEAHLSPPVDTSALTQLVEDGGLGARRIAYLSASDLVADVELTGSTALRILRDNPEAILDLIYDPSRRVEGATPAHDHDEDGGASLYLPILQHSFGSFDGATVGLPLYPPASGSFAAVTTNGITDRSGAKRLYCAGVTIPGGVLGVRISITEYNANDDPSVTLRCAFRHLSDVNYQLGVAPSEISADMVWGTSGAGEYTNQSIEIADLSGLGEPTLDRLLEFSLWLSCDPGAADLPLQICDLEILPLYLTPRARHATAQDRAAPQFSAREFTPGLAVLSAQVAAKARESYNGCARGLYGSTPGLFGDLSPDRRRRYMERVYGAHQHQGLYCPDGNGGVYSDGACLTDAQSLGYVVSLDEGGGLITHTPALGPTLHTSTLTTWKHYRFRRSIPCGLGALVFRFAVTPSHSLLLSTNPSYRLFVSLQIKPPGNGVDIVQRVLSGPYASPLETTDDDYGLCEIEPADDVAYRSNRSLDIKGDKGWNRSAEIGDAEQEALQLSEDEDGIPGVYRISTPVIALLSHSPSRGTAEHSTADYDVTLQFKLRNSAGTYDGRAAVQWIHCASAHGY